MPTSAEPGTRPWGERGPLATFAAEVDDSSRAEIEAVLAGWDRALFADPVDISVLVGGANNRNFVVHTPAAKYALRIASEQNERFAVDRAAALQAQEEAAAGGLAPAVLASQLPRGHVLSAFVEGETLAPEHLLQRRILELAGAALRRLHTLPSSLPAHSPFDDIRLWSRLARSDGTPIPAGLDQLLDIVWEIEALVEAAGPPLVFCHNDTYPQNIILSGSRLQLVDWDYAGRGWACFELGSFCATAALGPELRDAFLRSYDEQTNEAQVATVELMRFVAAMREAAWAVMATPILRGTTTPASGEDFYDNHLATYLGLARECAAAPDFDQLMQAAAGAREQRSW